MASTESKIKLIFEGVERGVVAAAAKAKAAVKSLGDENSKASKAFDTLDAAASKAGRALLTLGKAIFVLGTISATVNLIGGLVTSLAQLAPIVLVLPGALLAAGAAFGTLAIAMSGFNDTIAAGLHGDLANFNKGLAAMPPAMRDAAKAVVSFRPQLDALKKSVQQNFWSKFSGDIGKLGNNLLPTMTSGMTRIAAGLGQMVKGAVDVASTPFFRGQVASILVSTSAAIENMKPALGNVLAGFVSMAKVGAEFMPRLGQSITDVTAKFKAWATSVEGQEQIKRFIENAIQGFKDLAGIVKNLGSIFASVFTGLGATMQSPLALIKELTGELAAFLKTAEAQEGLRALGEILQAAGTAIKEIFLAAMKELLPTIKELAPGIKALIQGFKDFALDLIHTVGPALRDVGRFMAEHKDAIRDLVPIIGAAVLAFKGLSILRSVATWTTGAFGALRTLAGLLPGLGGAAGTAGTKLGGMVGPLKAIAGIVGLALIAEAIDRINIAVAGGDPAKLQGMEADLHGILEIGKQLASGDIGGVLDKLTADIDEFVDSWRRGNAPIQEFARTTLGQILLPNLAILTAQLDQHRPALAGFEAGLRGLASNDIANGITTLGDTIVGFGTKVAVTFNEKIQAGFEQTRQIVAAVPGNLVAALSPLAGLFGERANTATEEFKAKTQAGFDRTREIVAAVPGNLVTAISPLVGLFGERANTATEEFKAKTKAGFDRTREIVASVPGSINSALNPLAGLLGNTGTTSGNTFKDRLSAALRQAAPAAQTATSTVADACRRALSGLGGVGDAAGRNLGQGLVNGINALFGPVQRAAANIASVAAQAVAAASRQASPSKVWAELGKNMGAGLVVGLNDSQAGVSLASARLASAATNSAFGGGLAISAPNQTAAAVSSLGTSLTTQGPAPVSVRVFIGETELTHIVRTEVDSSNRATRRTVGAGAGSTF
jgi:hypothetical protein